jgi:hypothetical protein
MKKQAVIDKINAARKDDNAKMSELDVLVPNIFLRLAKFYHLEPERLARCLLYDFCLNPPKELIIVTRLVTDKQSA